MGTLRLATRGSPLALRQTELVSELLRQAHPGLEVEPVVVRTQGDRDASTPLDQIGGQGVFVTEVEAAVAEGRADAAVHSAKDMPSVMPEQFVLGAVPPRADPRDGLVGATLAGLPAGGLVATGSARRRAQLAASAPRSRVHRPAGEHGPAGGRGRGGQGLGRRRSPSPPWSASAGCTRCATCSTRWTCCRRRDRAPLRCSAGPTMRTPGSCWPPSTTSRVTGPCGPSVPSWRPSAGTAHCRSAPSPSRVPASRRCRRARAMRSGCRDSWPAATATRSSA